MASAVFDASAVLALLFDEAGVDVARSQLKGGAISCVNLAEVLAKLTDKGLPPAEAAEAVGFLGLDVMPMTEDHARASAAMRPATRRAGLSLGDRACLALAAELGVPAVTADRSWDGIAASVGARVLLIR